MLFLVKSIPIDPIVLKFENHQISRLIDSHIALIRQNSNAKSTEGPISLSLYVIILLLERRIYISKLFLKLSVGYDSIDEKERLIKSIWATSIDVDQYFGIHFECFERYSDFLVNTCTEESDQKSM